MSSHGDAVGSPARCRKRSSKRFRLSRRSCVSWAGVLVVVMLWTMYVRPVALGGSTVLVGIVGVSMEPYMQSGDLAFVQRQASYEVGDVVAFRPNAVNAPSIVVHRIVATEGAVGFRMQGDNNDRADPWTPSHEDVIGRLRWRVAYAGWLVRALHAWRG